MLSIIMDYDDVLGHIKISAFKNALNIITPSAIPGLPYLDKPGNIHLLGSNIAGNAFFNGFIF